MPNEAENIADLLAREGLSLAPLSRRIAAYIIDDFLMAIILVAIFWDKISNAQDPQIMINALQGSIFVAYLVRFFYQWIFTAQFGASIGKMALKIRVVDTTMLNNPSWGKSAIRSAFRCFGEACMYLPFLLVFEGPLKAALHDRVGKSVVILAEQKL